MLHARSASALVFGLAIFGAAFPARADAPSATATCERAAGPGRVRCEAELTASGGVVRWADVQIVETPSFVTALKGRIGPGDTTLREKEKWRFSFGLVARSRGTGDVRLQVRAIVCQKATTADAAETCEAKLIPIVVSVVSGA